MPESQPINIHPSTMIGKINKRYVVISNRVTKAYQNKFGVICDIYFPINDSGPNEYGTYEQVDIFARRQSTEYKDEPNADIVGAKLTIVHLFKKESMNSPEDQFDSFYLSDEDGDRPFIECSKAEEFPVMTKIVVYVENSISRFYIDKQTVVNGADGHIIMRQYLAPLSDNGGIQF